MDFETEIVHFDPERGRVLLQMVPDPRRYDTIVRDGRACIVDRFTGTSIDLDAIAEGFRGSHAPRAPSYYLPTRVGSASLYARGRLSAVRRLLESGAHVPPVPGPLPQRQLVLDGPRDVTFVSLDVCGATRMRANAPDAFDSALEIAFEELVTVVGQFYGSILKSTGDGFVAYVDHPSITARDSAVDLGLTLLAVLKESVNPALAEAGLPSLSIRIGAEHGPAVMRPLRSLGTGFEQQDVVSDALNRAVHLQEAAEPGSMLIGQGLRDQLHVEWLERCSATFATVGVALAERVGVTGYRSYGVR